MSVVKAEIAKKTTNWMIDKIGKYVGQQLEARKLKRAVDHFYTRLTNLRNIRTILSPEKAIDLTSIFIPPKVSLGENIIKLDSLQSFPCKDNLVILGIAGLGKSTLLRYLCANSMDFNEGFPIYIELRKIKKNETILDHAVLFLDIMGATVTTEILSKMLEDEKVVFFLDAFDEVQEDIRNDIANELINLSQKFISVRFIISARPGTNIEFLTNFTPIKLRYFEGNDYKNIIEKIYPKDSCDHLYKELEAAGNSIVDLLKTPLMVTILIVVHRSLCRIPKTIPSFYEHLFDVLLARHDALKITCNRNRKSHLNDELMRKCFDAFSYEATRKGFGPYLKPEVVALANKSIALNGQKCSGEDLLFDLKSITSLLLEEGGEYHFLHSSIREYFAATYIQSRPDQNRIKFYTGLIESPKEIFQWRQSLSFLEEIDKYACFKYFRIPEIDSLLDGFDPIETILSNEVVSGFSSKCNIYVYPSESKDQKSSKLSIAVTFPFDNKEIHAMFPILRCDYIESLRSAAKPGSPVITVTWLDLLKEPETHKAVHEMIYNLFSKYYAIREGMKQYLKKHEDRVNSSDAFDI